PEPTELAAQERAIEPLPRRGDMLRGVPLRFQVRLEFVEMCGKHSLALFLEGIGDSRFLAILAPQSLVEHRLRGGLIAAQRNALDQPFGVSKPPVPLAGLAADSLPGLRIGPRIRRLEEACHAIALSFPNRGRRDNPRRSIPALHPIATARS